ncbi:MAG: DNA mismatch repair endonuclease MutL [Clostridia bacterium]|nr:DNA mismatch repair endonuclease MutL [Clostridia bacterium]
MADLIAAGEVVERPASVVKELIENAIDAGAKNITVEIQNGGMTFLRVTDDGCGIADEDAETAFLRHATSKIRKQEDLEAIHTLGFRGEALAATAAVSHIDLITKTADAPLGTSLHLDGGVVTEHEQVGCPNGTTILVRNLFYNTPARMKFMKRDATEGSAVFSAVQKQAMAHPEISFRFIKDGTQELHTAGDGELMSAIYAIFGRNDAQNMLPVQSHWEKTSISGFVSRPTATRGTRAYQQFYVNGRYVKNRLLSSALEEAYKNQIMVGRFPACVLHITVPETSVDVNVHPAKTEVKFLSEKDVFDCIHYGVLSALNKASGRVAMELPKKPAAQNPPLPVSGKPYTPPKPATPPAKPVLKQDFFRTMSAEEYRSLQTVLDDKPAAPVKKETVKAFYDLPAKTEAPAPAKIEAPAPMIAAPAPVQSVQLREPEQQALPMEEVSYRIIGEAFDTYIIVEQGKTLLLIDKHAAHERILFEKLKAQKLEIMSQVLLEPILCSLAKEEAAAVLENTALLEKLGYFCEDFGDGTVILRRIPADILISDAEASLSALAGQLLSGKQTSLDSVRDELLHTIACKAATKAGYHSEPRDRERLVQEVLSRDDLKYCPHGRPICITLSEKQLEKQFKRV